jgi:hypothetical protein
MTSNGRQQTSQSVVKRCEAMLVSMISALRRPQNGHRMNSEIPILCEKLPQKVLFKQPYSRMCTRVCPEAAIMFPKCKAGPINGDAVSDANLQHEKMKIDISALLGGDV